MALVNSSTSSSATSGFLDREVEECYYINGAVWRREYLTGDTFKTAVALASVNLIAFFPTVLLNALIIFAVVTRRELRRINSNILLACLASVDLLTGLVAHPLGFAVQIKRILNDGPFCALEKALLLVTTGTAFVSLSHVGLIGTDRYIAIKHPLRYQDVVTKVRLTTAILFSWAVTMIMTIQEIILAVVNSGSDFYSIYLEVSGTVLTVTFLSFVGAIAYTYGYIFREAQRQRRRLRSEQLPREELKRMKKNNKAATTLAAYLAALVLTFLPGAIVVLVSFASENITVKPGVMSVLYAWVLTSALLGSLYNPIIFCWRIKKLRRVFLEILYL